MTEFLVEKLHTDEMVKAEMRDMLGAGSLKVTLGTIESLWLVDSPYLKGGDVKEEDLANAMSLIEHGDMEPLDFHKTLMDTLDTAWRAFEIIVPNKDSKDDGKHSEIEIFSPEWLADTISQACHALPSLTYREILWELPVAMTFHLAVSTARRNGEITRRPDDVQEAVRLLKEHNKKKRKESENA